jgi:WD40 repeat protein
MPKQIAQYKQYIDFANLSADGGRAISVLLDKSTEVPFLGVSVWDTQTGQEIKRYPQPSFANLLAMSPDGQHALILESQQVPRAGMSGRDGDEYDVEDTVIILDIDQNKTKTRTFSYQANANAGARDAVWLDNNHILILNWDSLMLWDTSFEGDGGEIITIKTDGNNWDNMLYSGEMVVLWRSGGQGKLPDVLTFIKPDTWELLRPKEFPDYKLNQWASNAKTRSKPIAFSPNHQQFAMLLNTQTRLAIRLVNDPTIQQTCDSDANIEAFAWSPDGAKIIVVAVDGRNIPDKDRKNRVWIWDIITNDKTLFAEISYTPYSTVKNLQWHGDRIYIVLSAEIMVWEV